MKNFNSISKNLMSLTSATTAEQDILFTLDNVSGPLAFPLTNDYMFRALLQRNNKVLKSLICSLLHLHPEEVISATIENPIELGTAIDNKTFFLDIKVCLNENNIINLEMQVLNEGNWSERSLIYLCRTYDSLNKGETYANVKRAIHIGFLDFTLFPEYPEFYATHKLINEKNHHIYTDKFVLSVVDLTQIHLATDEDKAWEIDYWASFFKATTWEEIKMLASENEMINEATQTMRVLSADETIRLQCEAREEYNRTMNYFRNVEKKLAEAEAELSKLQQEKEVELNELAGLQAENEHLKKLLNQS